MSDVDKLNELYAEVRLCTSTLAECTARAQQARNQETDALNRLNEAQKAFDEYVVVLRKNAPTSSDWRKADQPLFHIT